MLFNVIVIILLVFCFWMILGFRLNNLFNNWCFKRLDCVVEKLLSFLFLM